MENGDEFSSSMNFASSSSLSNGPHMPSCSGSVEFLSLNELSSGLEKLLTYADEFDYSDAEIVVEGVSVGVNRCILAARSGFFHDKFKKERGNEDSAKEAGKPKFLITELVPCGKVGYEAFLTVLNYLYTGKLRTYAPEVSTCVDESCVHHACRPAIDYAVELMYASATFQITELFMVVQRHLFSLLDEALEDDVIPILLVAFHCSLSQLLEQCVQRITRSNIDAFTLEKELPYEVLRDIRASRIPIRPVVVDSVKEKRIGKIVKVLDSDDIELVKLLLEESNVTLDDACALHFAAAYCTPKIVNEVLSLGLADLNRRNVQGYTALHVAARRRDLSIIVGLLSNGASVMDAAMNGHNAVTICRRLTRPKEYYKAPKHGQETSNDWLCIDVLEREMLRNPICLRNLCQPSSSSSMLDEELVMDLYILENRVALARVLFPREAKLAMEMARADSTSEFAGLSSTEGNLRCLDLKELPPFQVKQLKDRMGTFNRNLAEFLDRKVMANTVPVDGVYSFDILDRATNILNRIYKPAPENEARWGLLELENPLSTTEVVPVIVFFHGGSFTHSSANSSIYDTFCRRVVKICGAVVVSVDYRRSPEHRYPCAYDDGWSALKWVHSRQWLKSGKEGKVHVYLAGDSSGGNIAHHVAVRAAETGDVEVLGNILLHPMFGGQQRTESEMKLDGKYFVTVRDRDWYWRAFLPEGEDRDHPACNIFGPRSKSLEGLKLPKSLVVVADLDLSQDWQLAYVEGLQRSGQDVKLLHLKQATIGFYFLPNTDHFFSLMEEITEFIHPNCS